jgi:glycerol-1-phosphate dehydrogenase [NAD(P)+]
VMPCGPGAPRLLRERLGRLDPGGNPSCACGREHPIAAAEVLVAGDATLGAADLLRRRYGASPTIWVLSDENTETAAGARWKSACGGTKVRSRVLPAAPRPVPTLELADALAAEVMGSPPDLLVAVGSGVISDLVKRVSLRAGVPSWCIATAPSVDAFSSASAALRVAGYHQSVPARASEVIVCDLEVLRRAPRVLVLAGLGDLLAKLVAHLDWKVASLLAGEPFCATVADLALEAAREAIAAARALETDPGAAARSLIEASLVSGFAMQAMGGSRPAASAEHTIAHFWETASAARSEAHDLHGILVGAACALILPGYLELYRRLTAVEPDVEERLAACAAERPWEETLEEGMRPYAGTIALAMRGRRFDAAVLARHLAAFVQHRERIVALAAPVLAQLSEALHLLEGLGFPSLGALRIPEVQRLLPVRNVRLLRDRYTSFDLACELGMEREMVAAIAAAQRVSADNG